MRAPIARLCLAAFLLPLGCGGAPAPAPALVQPARAPASASASTSAASSPDAPPPAAEPPASLSPFSPVVVRGPRALRFFPLKHFGVALHGEYISSNPTPLRIDEQGARIDTTLGAGILQSLGEATAFMVLDLRGDLPTQGALDINIPGDRGGSDYTLTWKGARWQRTPSGEPHADKPPEVVQAYYMGTLLGQTAWGERTLFETVNYDDDHTSTLKLVLGGKGQAPPLPTLTPGEGGCSTKIVAHTDLEVLPSGELLGFGKVCTKGTIVVYGTQTGDGPLAVERWAKGSRKATISVLPGSEARSVLLPGGQIVAHGPDDIHLFANLTAAAGESEQPYVAHYNGAAWTEEKTGAKEHIERLTRTADGAVWLELETEVRRRKKGGAWEALVPPGPRVRFEWIRRAPDETLWGRRGDGLFHLDGDGRWETVGMPKLDGRVLVPESVHWVKAAMFVVASHPESGDSYVLREGAAEKALDYEVATAARSGGGGAGEGKPPTAAAVMDAKGAKGAKEPPAFGRVRPGSPSCKELFVVLYKLAKVAPADYDFPLTRVALKGHTELEGLSFAETEDGGRRYFVAFAPNYDKAHRLAEIVRDGVKGSTPQILCGTPPKTNRALRIDLRTGNLVK